MTAQPDAGKTEQDPEGQAFCYRHPLRETGVRCIRCDRPICPDCMRPASVGFQCPDDVRIGSLEQRAPRTIAGAQVRDRQPYATWSFIAANVVVYLITAIQSVHGFSNPNDSSLFIKWVLEPKQVALHDQYYRLITSAFLHVSIWHVGFNMIALYFVGPYLERLLGAWRFVALYLLSALGGSVAVYLFASKYSGTVGASGAIFGLFAACLMFVRELGLDPRWLVGTIALNFLLTFSIADISKYGHLGGFVFGAATSVVIAGVPWRPRRRLPLPVQLYGMGGIAVLLVGLITWRTAVL
jgi:membrane associated rhomboid family serine protease